ncbi:hypothetical protein ACFLWK_00775 [Chloroflexota bacterium]
MWKQRVKSKEFGGGVGTIAVGIGTWITTGGLNPPTPIPIGYWIGIGLIVFGILAILYALFKPNQSNQAMRMEKYAEMVILEKKANPLLALPNALQKLRECDIEILNRRKYIKVPLAKISVIQGQLQKHANIAPAKSVDNYTEEQIRNVIGNTTTKLKIKAEILDANTQIFMLKVAGVLDENKIGISRFRVKDDRYISLAGLTALVETEELRNAIRTFKWGSLGMNSMLLLTIIFPRTMVDVIMESLGKTTTELIAERDDALDGILQNINVFIRGELKYGSNKRR